MPAVAALPAITRGLASSARTITCAALIMVAVFKVPGLHTGSGGQDLNCDLRVMSRRLHLTSSHVRVERHRGKSANGNIVQCPPMSRSGYVNDVAIG